ncbi:MAG: hypothetical protein AB1635_11125 [Acidobacteriota bacterium]
MSRELPGLPPALVERLRADRDGLDAGLGILVCSMDEAGRPHPMMLSPLEIVALDARTLRVATYADSRSTRFLDARGHVTVMFVDAGEAVYVKGAAWRLPPPAGFPGLARFEVRAIVVLEDATDAGLEGAAVIESGIRVRRPGVEPAEAFALLQALASREDK